MASAPPSSAPLRSAPLRIAGASGFWGDRNDALLDQVRVGPVERYELPNSQALNFVLRRALDTQGKTYGFALLRMGVEVPDDLDVPSLV